MPPKQVSAADHQHRIRCQRRGVRAHRDEHRGGDGPLQRFDDARHEERDGADRKERTKERIQLDHATEMALVRVPCHLIEIHVDPREHLVEVQDDNVPRRAVGIPEECHDVVVRSGWLPSLRPVQPGGTQQHEETANAYLEVHRADGAQNSVDAHHPCEHERNNRHKEVGGRTLLETERHANASLSLHAAPSLKIQLLKFLHRNTHVQRTMKIHQAWSGSEDFLAMADFCDAHACSERDLLDPHITYH